jgi:predicted transcriptional regulator
MSKTLAARVDDDLAAELEQLARDTGRSRSALIENALRSYVISERDFLSKVNAGLADLEAGRLTDHEAVATAIRRFYRPVA